MRYERIATTAGFVPTVRDLTPAPAPTRPPPRGAPPRTPRPGRVASDRSSQVRLQIFDLLTPWVVGVATLIARMATAATGTTDWDSAQYATAVSRFDVNHGRPQPPGYWLYVEAGRLVHSSGMATVESLVLVSALASALASGLVVVAGRDLGGRWVGLAAGVLIATSPFAWFSGSIVSTYSFDLALSPLLIILAWRARPHSWHGAAALVALGLAAGFRQSTLLMFGVLALMALLGSIRRVREALAAVVAGALAVAVWFVPMALAQPGGISVWAAATRAESNGALLSTSVLDHATAGADNVGTFAAYTTVALAPLVVLAVLAAVGLGLRALARMLSSGRRSVAHAVHETVDATSVAALPTTPGRAHSARVGRRQRRLMNWRRPWFQSRTVILLAATVPPMVVVALVEFAKGGYLLAYLPGAVIALLLVPGALLRTGSTGPPGRRRRSGGAMAWAVLATLAVGAIAVFGADRFLTASGVLPVASHAGHNGPWLTQVRYQAPYPDTRAAIRSADATENELARLAPLVDPRRDVVVVNSMDAGIDFYRTAGWALPADRVTLVSPGAAIYNELGGSLYYAQQSTVSAGPGGSTFFIAKPSLPGMRRTGGRGNGHAGAWGTSHRRLPRVEVRPRHVHPRGDVHRDRRSPATRPGPRRLTPHPAPRPGPRGSGRCGPPPAPRHHRFDERGVAVDDQGPAEPGVHVGPALPPEVRTEPVLGDQPVDGHLELAVAVEAEATARTSAVFHGGRAAGVDQHRGPGTPCLGHHQ